jgi:hypothetical protein
MRWHRLCVLWMLPWMYTTASLHDADGNDGATASGGNDGASASNDALASPLCPLDAPVDDLCHLSAQRQREQWRNGQRRQRRRQCIE